MIHAVGQGQLELDNDALAQLGEGGEGGKAARQHELHEGAVAQHLVALRGGRRPERSVGARVAWRVDAMR
jgi:hypothetical protein